MPTATWKSRLRSGSAHCDLQLAVEVRQCPLGSGARGGGPAVPTGIWTARRRRRVRRRRRRRRRRALLKSSNPHLAGREIYIYIYIYCVLYTHIHPMNYHSICHPYLIHIPPKVLGFQACPPRSGRFPWSPWSDLTTAFRPFFLRESMRSRFEKQTWEI